MTTEPAQRASPDWLDLRWAADAEARDRGATDLLERLVAHLRGPDRDQGPVRVVDVGAGTGANRRYLSPRLPVEQEWVCVDHDRELLDHPRHDGARRIHCGLTDLPAEVAGLGAPVGPAAVVVANAVLDVLTTADLAALADCVVATGGIALLSLSVTGQVRWEPPDPVDDVLARAFDDHQRRDGRPGPDGRHRELLARWLEERVEDAAGQEPASAEVLREWQARRAAQMESGALRVLVDHVDLLVLGRDWADGAQRGA
ncbi:SAM-dependent methyltransferase [Ornithinimicrobium kibberense]|uniref:Methyltransferase family protein n=1 Tax=Ornithinimicrobium kibberense TaxID=282060 RepID=A0ABV5V2K7_9MICO|nr:SAM-dependent methyltransferase [Ornithinimicrobium kibberense]